MHAMSASVASVFIVYFLSALVCACVHFNSEEQGSCQHGLNFTMSRKCFATTTFVTVDVKHDAVSTLTCHFSRSSDSSCYSSAKSSFCSCNSHTLEYGMRWSVPANAKYSKVTCKVIGRSESGVVFNEVLTKDHRVLPSCVTTDQPDLGPSTRTSRFLTDQSTETDDSSSVSYTRVHYDVSSNDEFPKFENFTFVLYIALGCIFLLFLVILLMGIALNRKVSHANKQLVTPVPGYETAKLECTHPARVRDSSEQCESVTSVVSSDAYDELDVISSKDLSSYSSMDNMTDTDNRSDGYSKPMISDTEVDESSASTSPNHIMVLVVDDYHGEGVISTNPLLHTYATSTYKLYLHPVASNEESKDNTEART